MKAHYLESSKFLQGLQHLLLCEYSFERMTVVWRYPIKYLCNHHILLLCLLQLTVAVIS